MSPLGWSIPAGETLSASATFGRHLTRRLLLIGMVCAVVGAACTSPTSPPPVSPAPSPTPSPVPVAPTPTPAPSPTPIEPDQENLVPTNDSAGCGASPLGEGTLYQGFTPGASRLAVVMLRVRAGGTFPAAGFTSRVAIRSDSPHGAEIARTEAVVTGPRAIGEVVDLRFDLSTPEPVRLTPGRSYVIAWPSPNEGDGVLTWMRATSDSYSGGQAYDCSGNARPDNDFIFATYSESQ